MSGLYGITVQAAFYLRVYYFGNKEIYASI